MRRTQLLTNITAAQSHGTRLLTYEHLSESGETYSHAPFMPLMPSRLNYEDEEYSVVDEHHGSSKSSSAAADLLLATILEHMRRDQSNARSSSRYVHLDVLVRVVQCRLKLGDRRSNTKTYELDGCPVTLIRNSGELRCEVDTVVTGGLEEDE